MRLWSIDAAGWCSPVFPHNLFLQSARWLCVAVQLSRGRLPHRVGFDGAIAWLEVGELLTIIESVYLFTAPMKWVCPLPIKASMLQAHVVDNVVRSSEGGRAAPCVR
jgi:hypothetical protein